MAMTIISGTDAATADALWTLIRPLKQEVRAYLGNLIQQSLSEEKVAADKRALFQNVKGAWKE